MATEHANPYGERAELLRKMEPQLVANVKLFSTEQGGKSTPAYPGWGCPCMVSTMQPLSGYDGWPLLDETPLDPGEEREVGFVFLTPEGAEIMKRAGRFYLWEGRFVGEATVAAQSSSSS